MSDPKSVTIAEIMAEAQKGDFFDETFTTLQELWLTRLQQQWVEEGEAEDVAAFEEQQAEDKRRFELQLRLEQVPVVGADGEQKLDELGNPMFRPLREADFEERVRQYDLNKAQEKDVFEKERQLKKRGQTLGFLQSIFPSMLQAQTRLLTDPGAAAVSHLLGGGKTPAPLMGMLGNLGERLRGILGTALPGLQPQLPLGTMAPGAQPVPGTTLPGTQPSPSLSIGPEPSIVPPVHPFDPSLEQPGGPGFTTERKAPRTVSDLMGFAFPRGAPNVQDIARLLPSEQQALGGLTSFLGIPSGLLAKSVQQTSPGGLPAQTIPQIPGVTR